MTRNLKVLGIALAAVFALSAVLASAASAQNGTITTTGPVKLDGVNRTKAVGTNVPTWSFPKQGAASIECPNALYTGFKYNVTPHTFVPNDVSTFTVIPHYGECTATIGAATFPATVDLNGCDYNFHIENTTGNINEYFLGTTIAGCETGKHITVTIWQTSALHKEGKTPFCAITLLEKATDYTGLRVTDTTKGDAEIKGTITGIKVTKTSPSGSILCPEETDENSKLDADLTVTGTNEGGTATPISLSHL